MNFSRKLLLRVLIPFSVGAAAVWEIWLNLEIFFKYFDEMKATYIKFAKSYKLSYLAT